MLHRIFFLAIVLSFVVPVRAQNNDVFCFYYNWYGNPAHDGKYIHWAHPVMRSGPSDSTTRSLPGGNDIAANFYPALGAYSSLDGAIVKQHMQMIVQAGIGVIVVTWWNKDDFMDKSIPLILNEAAAAGIKVAFHIEPFNGRNAVTTRQAIEYITDTYGKHPAFYRSTKHQNKPFIFIYDSYLTPAKDWAELLQPNGAVSIRNTKYDAVMIGLWVKKNEEAFFKGSGFDGMYTYFAASGFTYGSTPANWPAMQQWAVANKKIFIPCVGPGYIDTRVRPWNDKTTRARAGGAYYGDMFKKAIESKAPYIGITSFNEWHEGTQIEPAVPFAPKEFKYLDYTPAEPDYYLKLTKRWIKRMHK
jgi:hypothetical protein